MTLELIFKDIKDVYVRENFFRLKKFFDKNVILKPDFRHFEIVFTAAVTNFRFKHGLGYLPKDIIQTSSIGAGALTWNYSLFTDEFLDITTTGVVTVRAFIGTYREDLR